MKTLIIILCVALSLSAVTKTVGSGGDYADWKAAVDWLKTQEPLSDNYTFNAISDFTTGFGNQQAITATSGLTVTFDGNEFTTTATGGGIIRIAIGGGSYVVNYVFCNINADVSGMSGTAFRHGAGSGDGTAYYNLKIYSSSMRNVIGIVPGNSQGASYGYWKIYNCIFSRLYRGIWQDGSGGGSNIHIYNKRYIENCTFFDCGIFAGGVHYYGCMFGYVFNKAHIKARNLCFVRNDGVQDHDVTFTDNTSTLTHSTGSSTYHLDSLEEALPDSVTDCTEELVATDQYIDTSFLSSDFVRPVVLLGDSGIYNRGIVPTVTTVDFDSVVYGYNTFFPTGAFQCIRSLKIHDLFPLF
jgi:hypothetical protein